jgi:HEAT repeat protein
MDATARGYAAATARDWDQLAAQVKGDEDPRVRAIALATLAQHAPRTVAVGAWKVAAADIDPRVRLRAAQVAPALERSVPLAAMLALLRDDDAWVAEAAAFALGERPRPTARAVGALTTAASTHDDPLVREAAVAALGAIGDQHTLDVILAACDDKPAIRRRAVLALAAFEGDEVEARLQRALEDPDWQVRQAAEDLLHISAAPADVREGDAQDGDDPD